MGGKRRLLSGLIVLAMLIIITGCSDVNSVQAVVDQFMEAWSTCPVFFNATGRNPLFFVEAVD